MSDLIERLRGGSTNKKDLGNMAADELERLRRENEALAQKFAELEEKAAVLTQLNEQIDQKINFTKDLERENEEHIRQINLRNDTIDDLRELIKELRRMVGGSDARHYPQEQRA